MSLLPELFDDGGADALDPLDGRRQVLEDRVVADGLVLGGEESLGFLPDCGQLSFPLVELSGAIVGVTVSIKDEI